jgi:hypothetical protein
MQLHLHIPSPLRLPAMARAMALLLLLLLACASAPASAAAGSFTVIRADRKVRSSIMPSSSAGMDLALFEEIEKLWNSSHRDTSLS